MPVSKSPDRNTFQKNGYVKRCLEKGETPDPTVLAYYESWDAADDDWASEEEHKNDLEWDLRTTTWILEKARSSESYAQNLYAALCNMQWCKRELWPVLKEEYWSCSWRSAGGIIANMRQEGDYIDWYCSGMRGAGDYGDDTDEHNAQKNFVSEGTVTDEIYTDLNTLGWMPVPYKDEDI